MKKLLRFIFDLLVLDIDEQFIHEQVETLQHDSLLLKLLHAIDSPKINKIHHSHFHSIY